MASVKTSTLLKSYAPPRGVADELLDMDGKLRPVWWPLIDLLSRQTPEALAARTAAGDQYLNDAGVYFRQLGDGNSSERTWPLSHIPVMLDQAEWKQVSQGIVQRAELLEMVMADLYGPASLVHEGLLPPDLIARNPEWLRPMVNVAPRSGHYLHFLAFEIGRSPDGTWFVLGDRTQAPSGSGFALENRVATSRVFSDLYPNANVERLAGFFRAFRDALNGLRVSDDQRVGILTPGPQTDTYFEHAYIARYLGFALLESGDLKAEAGNVSIRTIAGQQPVSVLWRRLDARFADPLELDEGSALGTPGLVSALREGALTMVNALGSGVLESRALLAFMPRIAEKLLRQPLLLPNIATWWCGQAQERAYVRENLDRMMIGPALSQRQPFDLEPSSWFGRSFLEESDKNVDDWLEREGDRLVAQEAVTLSTTPALSEGRLVPRPMTVRVFAARTPDGWTVMPGGYARIGKSEDPRALSMQSGGSVADVWVVGQKPVQVDSLAPPATGPFTRRMPGFLPSRAADNLFWLGRYVERAEFVIREIRAYHKRLSESGGTDLQLLEDLAVFLEAYGTEVTEPVPQNLRDLIQSAKNCAARIRDRFSIDGWSALSDLSRSVEAMSGNALPGEEVARSMTLLLRKLAGFSGLVHENMFRFMGWRFLTIGRALERADSMAALLETFATEEGTSGGFDLAVEVGDSVMTHQRRYSIQTNRNTVIDLLVLDHLNPRSILFQIEQIKTQNEALPLSEHHGRVSQLTRLVVQLHSDLTTATPEEIDTAALRDIRSQIAAMSDALDQQYLS